jgi:transposase
MPGTTPFSKDNIVWLREQSFGFMDDAILRSDLAVLEAVDGRVTLIEERIAAIAAEDRRVRLLMMMTGVGYFTAMPVMAEVGDVGRFLGDKEFASWMGLAPSVHQSGERIRMGGVSGPGNKRLRWDWLSVLGLRFGMIPGSVGSMSGCRSGVVRGVRWWLWLMRWRGSCTSC